MPTTPFRSDGLVNIPAPMRDFDSVAAQWDQKTRRVQLAHKVAATIVAAVKPTKTTRALDFGCGTGLVTLALAPLVREIVAADSSKGMLEQLSAKLVEGSANNVQPLLLAHDGTGGLPAPFDLVVSSMTMHHIADVAGQIQRFSALLSPGGHLCIADLDAEDGNFHDDPTGIQHHGFSKAVMEQFFAAAGLEEVDTVPVMAIQKARAGGVTTYTVNLTIGCRGD